MIDRILESRNTRLYCLTEEEVIKLAKWCLEIEKHFSAKRGHYQPMDIEWAKDGKTGQLFIVQARPETVQSGKDKNVLKEYKLGKKSEVVVSGIAVGGKVALMPIALGTSAGQ